MNPKKINPKWLRFSEETNALDYLVKVEDFVRQAIKDKKAWKWVVLSLHGALYGFAISACKGTDYTTITKKTNNGKDLLISFNEALKKCQDPKWMGTLYGGIALKLSDSQKLSIRILKETLRNNFEHYIPRGWLIEVHVLPQMTLDILDIIRFLSIETRRYQHLNHTQIKKIKSVVFQCRKFLKKHPLYIDLNT